MIPPQPDRSNAAHGDLWADMATRADRERLSRALHDCRVVLVTAALALALGWFAAAATCTWTALPALIDAAKLRATY